MVEVRLKYDYKLGDINVCDLKNVKFSSLSKFTPMMMKTTIQIVQVCVFGLSTFNDY